MPPNPNIPTFPSPEEISNLPIPKLLELSGNLRTFLIDTLLLQGGHFAANLGVIELTVALLNQFNPLLSPIVWDVGHQSYPYKILTDRIQQFRNIRSFNGISGFPKIAESPFDHFGTGHSSTSISAILGMATASKIKNVNIPHIAVIGDGALTGGMAFEALNNILNSDLNIIIILNDNNIGIDPNTGAINKHLNTNFKIKEFFEWFGLSYHGPIDGHDISQLTENLKLLKQQHSPRLLHIKTVKGKGYEPAEKEQTRWHSAPKYDKFQPVTSLNEKPTKWSDAFGENLLLLLQNNPLVIGISPAMTSSCGMSNSMLKFPNRVFDVGISEQHALTFAAGAAKQGLLPVVNIYSTFLQRAYDQLIHDIALQKLPVLLCIDRAGLVGEDGPTHHGVFDISFLLPIPNLRVFCPNSKQELSQAFDWFINNQTPTVIRYPRGNVPNYIIKQKNINQEEVNSDSKSTNLFNPFHNFTLAANAANSNHNVISNSIHTQSNKKSTAVLSCGNATNWALQAFQENSNIQIIHFNQIKPLENLSQLTHFNTLITIEDGTIIGGFGHYIKAEFENQFPQTAQNQHWYHKGIPDHFVSHGSVDELLNSISLDSKSLHQFLQQLPTP